MKTDYLTLQKLISDAQKCRRDNFKYRAERNRLWYSGDYYDTGVNDHPLSDNEKMLYSVNLTKEIVQVIRTSIYSKIPEFSFLIKGNFTQSRQKEMQKAIGQVVPGTGIQLDKLSRSLETGIKLELKMMKVNKTNKRIVKDAVLYGFGVGKLGYKYRIDKKTEAHLTENQDELKKIGLSVNDVDVSDLLRSENPYFVRVDPGLILLPPEYPDTLPWIVQEIYIDKEVAEKKYKVKNLRVTSVDSSFGQEKKDLSNKVKLYEFHNLDENNPKIIVMAEGYPKIIKETKHPLVNAAGNVKNLFKLLCFDDPEDGVYPKSDIDTVSPQIMEANLQIRRRVENARRFNNQYIITGSWDNDVINAIKKGGDGDVHHVIDKDAKIHQVPKLSNGQEFYENIRAIRSEMFEVLGLTDYSVGGTTEKRKATEAHFVEAGRRDRVNDRMGHIEEFMQDVIDTLVELLREYQVSDKIFRVQHGNSETSFIMNSKLLALSDADIVVIRGSTVELDHNLQIKKTQATAQAAQAFAGVTDLRKLAKQVYTDLGWNAEEFLLDVPPQSGSVPGADGRTPRIKNNIPESGDVDLLQEQRGGVEQ